MSQDDWKCQISRNRKELSTMHILLKNLAHSPWHISWESLNAVLFPSDASYHKRIFQEFQKILSDPTFVFVPTGVLIWIAYDSWTEFNDYPCFMTSLGLVGSGEKQTDVAHLRIDMLLKALNYGYLADPQVYLRYCKNLRGYVDHFIVACLF